MSSHTPVPEPVTRLPVPVQRSAREKWLRRRNLERQLHDGAALRISALTLQLGLFRHHVPEAPELQELIDGLQDELHAVLQELRDVAGRIYPPLLDDAGLGPALREAVGRCGGSVRIEATDDRFGSSAEGVAYFAVLECVETLGTAAGPVTVVVRRDVDALVLEVRGVHPRHAAQMLAEVWQVGGTIDVAGEGVSSTITVRITCE